MPYRLWNNVALPAASALTALALIGLALTACASSTNDMPEPGLATGTPAANAAFVAAGFDAVFGANSKDDPAVSCDLFRIEKGLIAEHWDVLQTDPNSRGETFDSLGKNAAGHTMFQ